MSWRPDDDVKYGYPRFGGRERRWFVRSIYALLPRRWEKAYPNLGPITRDMAEGAARTLEPRAIDFVEWEPAEAFAGREFSAGHWLVCWTAVLEEVSRRHGELVGHYAAIEDANLSGGLDEWLLADLRGTAPAGPQGPSLRDVLAAESEEVPLPSDGEMEDDDCCSDSQHQCADKSQAALAELREEARARSRDVALAEAFNDRAAEIVATDPRGAEFRFNTDSRGPGYLERIVRVKEDDIRAEVVADDETGTVYLSLYCDTTTDWCAEGRISLSSAAAAARALMELIDRARRVGLFGD